VEPFRGDQSPLLKLIALDGTVIAPPSAAPGKWDVRSVARGLYIADVYVHQKHYRYKLVRN
jgi:hypothetical protein